ncbi:ZFYVE28 [Cordylochernes scorpioides]|uniref:Lateral signaling target protein 2 homolog n=1 Tax=Cordylochernes scorpioides TaxID=51811 RepID=A0ABY6LUJ5_9ARAC|nr:ZFYVE28 [Cordylochernes scorpioides]
MYSAVYRGLLVYPEGPLNVDASPSGMSELFRPFHSLLYKIRTCREQKGWCCRDLLRTLTSEELGFLEKMLCSLEDPKAVAFPPSPGSGLAVGCGGQELCKQFVRDFYAFNFGDSREEEEEEEEETNNNLVAAESPVQVSDTVHTAQRRLELSSVQVEIEDVCSCQDEGVFSEEVATARTVLSHVMQRVEIVPPANIPTTAPLPCPLSLLASEPLGVPRRVQALRSPSISSTDTSPYDSDCPPDDAELALALQAAEIATCHQARARFRSAEELLHKLFVCIAGVADQLQTNFASDLRNILKCVFDMNSSVTPELMPPSPPGSTTTEEGERDSIDSAEEVLPDDSVSSPSPAVRGLTDLLPDQRVCCLEPPVWVPDTESDHCMACGAIFTLLRRRHHCRHCGRLFCARCSSNSIPLPRFGQHKPVRVCDECFRYQLTPFTVQQPC